MSKIICHHNGRYNFYSTISDGFCYVSSISLDQLTHLIKEEYGESGLRELPKRLERAHKFGSSSMFREQLDVFLCCNRAGENEAKLSTEECIKRFLS